MSGFKYIETTNKVSKAQKRRDAKAAKKAEQLKRIEEAEKLDEHRDRRLEEESLSKLLRKKGFQVHDIDADGDCLYRAVEHQLSIADDTIIPYSFMDIRSQTSKYMLDNSDSFMPFLLDDEGNLMSESDYRDYCIRVAKTKQWGGHLELTAIAELTRKPIHIYQADNSSPIIIEPKLRVDRKPISLSFHKHLYHLGEHYNSLVRENRSN